MRQRLRFAAREKRRVSFVRVVPPALFGGQAGRPLK